MDRHNLPADIDLDDHYASMESHVPPNAVQRSNLIWSSTSEAVTSEEHVVQAINFAERVDEHVLRDKEVITPCDDRLRTLYDTYHTSYAIPISETSAHMQHAGDLALALLQRHYSNSHGYLVELAALGPYSAKGVNFVLKESDEPDSDPDNLPPKKQKHAARKTHAHHSYRASWHHIAPENMAAFVVKKRVSEVRDGVEQMTYRTHTCLVIVLDDLSTFQRWSRDNMNHRGDVLSDMLTGVEKGHGMLFFGPRLELYSYDANNDSQPVKPSQILDWRMDMRTTSLATVDEALRNFAKKEVVYKDSS